MCSVGKGTACVALQFMLHCVCMCRLVRSFVPSVSLGAPQASGRGYTGVLWCGWSNTLVAIGYTCTQDAPDELYGPTVINFSLVAILLFGMKTSGHIVVGP